MRCPYCRANDDKVVDSRLSEEAVSIRRRRECLACGRRFTTYERIEEAPLLIAKRGGGTEPFDAVKLRSGIERSASGRLDDARVDQLVADVEEELRATGGEVSSDRVGMAVLERLRTLDHVAYMRFASVYKGFEDLADFQREVGELQKTTEPKPR